MSLSMPLPTSLPTSDLVPNACPSCQAPMEQRRFARQFYGEVVVDLCWSCKTFWFDQYESTQLSPGSVIELFRLIHEHRASPSRALADRMTCPHCAAKLLLTHDLQRTNRFLYHRCAHGHGRLTTFFQFLREKQFVRSLSRTEIDKLKATVRQVRCSSCGSTVDLARDGACSYCRAPISVLDAAAVEKTLAALTHAERLRTSPNASEMAAAFESLLATKEAAPRGSLWTRELPNMHSTPALIDLVAEGIGRLFR